MVSEMKQMWQEDLISSNLHTLWSYSQFGPFTSIMKENQRVNYILHTERNFNWIENYYWVRD